MISCVLDLASGSGLGARGSGLGARGSGLWLQISRIRDLSTTPFWIWKFSDAHLLAEEGTKTVHINLNKRKDEKVRKYSTALQFLKSNESKCHALHFSRDKRYYLIIYTPWQTRWVLYCIHVDKPNKHCQFVLGTIKFQLKDETS